MAKYDVPEDLVAAQLEWHQVRSEYAALCRSLPSAVPPPGGQHREVRRLRERLLALSEQVTTHPFWDTVPDGGDATRGPGDTHPEDAHPDHARPVRRVA